MGTTTAALTASQRARKNCLIPSSGLDPADSSLHFCLVSGTCGRCVVGKTLCSFPVAARASGTYEGALRRFTSATGCQEPVNRNEFEWPPFATSYSPGYLLTGEESIQLAREWSGLNVIRMNLICGWILYCTQFLCSNVVTKHQPHPGSHRYTPNSISW